MRQLARMLLTALVAVGLLSTGCDDKKSEEASATRKEEKAKPATEEKTDEAKEAAEATEDATKDDTEKEIAEAVKMAEAVDTSGAPESLKKMVEHLKNTAKAIQDNMPDCKKAAESAKTYMDENKEEMDKLSKELKGIGEKLTTEEAAKLGQQVTALMVPAMAEMQKAVTEFAQKCPQQAASVGKLMQAVSP